MGDKEGAGNRGGYRGTLTFYAPQCSLAYCGSENQAVICVFIVAVARILPRLSAREPETSISKGANWSVRTELGNKEVRPMLLSVTIAAKEKPTFIARRRRLRIRQVPSDHYLTR